MSYFLPPAGGGFTVGGAVAGAIMNEILRNDMMVYLRYYKKSELCKGYHHYILPSQQSAELAQLLPVEE